MVILRQSDPRAAHRRVYFTAVDTSNLQSRLQASDMSTFTLKLSKAGSAPAAPTATTPVELSATNAKGSFYIELAAADLDTPGPAELVITNTGGTKTMEPREIPLFVQQSWFSTVVSGLSVSSFTCDRAETTDNYWRDTYVRVLTGACAGQGGKKVGTYTGSSKLVSLAPGLQFTASLSTNDIIEFING